jgi:RNA polymerase sigma-70 factor (ECF subfamily)
VVEKEVVEELYRRYWVQIERRCLRLLSDKTLAADAAQETFVRLLTKGGEFRKDAEWTTWLYRVSTNICLNTLRARGRRGGAWQQRVAHSMPKAVAAIDEPVMLKNALQVAMRRFDEVTQQIAVFTFVDDMTQEEIGNILGLSRVTINKKLMRLRTAFAELTTQEVPP